MLVMAENCNLVVLLTTAFAKDFTWLEPPAQVQEVDQTSVLPESDVIVLHCEPDVASASFQRSWYTV